ERRQAEWRLWAEMWTYAARDRAFAEQLVETDALWEQEIRVVLEELKASGLARDVDVDVETPVLARLIDGLGLRAWLSGRWPEACRQLVLHLETLGVPAGVLEEILAEEGAQWAASGRSARAGGGGPA